MAKSLDNVGRVLATMVAVAATILVGMRCGFFQRPERAATPKAEIGNEAVL